MEVTDETVIVIDPTLCSPCTFFYIRPWRLINHHVPNSIVSAHCRLWKTNISVDVGCGCTQCETVRPKVISQLCTMSLVLISRHNPSNVIEIIGEEEALVTLEGF